MRHKKRREEINPCLINQTVFSEKLQKNGVLFNVSIYQLYNLEDIVYLSLLGMVEILSPSQGTLSAHPPKKKMLLEFGKHGINFISVSRGGISVSKTFGCSWIDFHHRYYLHLGPWLDFIFFSISTTIFSLDIWAPDPNPPCSCSSLLRNLQTLQGQIINEIHHLSLHTGSPLLAVF